MKKVPAKKVSSEYSSEIMFRNQEGLKFSSVNFFEGEDEGGQARYGVSTEQTMQMRGTTNFLQFFKLSQFFLVFLININGMGCV